ncbi:UDP-N-acetylmuramoyl-tripeptide--D-alanyl-D-alanine ligase [Venatoribacter cucullus]|uniref:UDP-N-acetylmuramoyl-tripeptide--D-alanyl-D- alanine ligase n=1 Tax=Venatoribacter cucullus TaxID=2661630 RepID=UPI002240B1D1|nr:UDP-N-acetylmuramoyl-tripeptide--D-alanyl-D-alanine ligase [Venatoribacter cucullus]
MLKSFTVQEIAKVTGAQVMADADLMVTGISTDSRTVQPGDLYVALRGERFDGHDFIAPAGNAGAVAALVETAQANAGIVQLQVANTLQALGELAGYNRSLFNGPVVAVTGSAGKTSVKQLMHSVLSQQFNTWMTQGNLNNHIGAPLSLLALQPQHEAAVIELGASGAGEIAYTAQWVKPVVGIITNAAEAHIEGFGSLEGVMQTKGELLDFIQPGGTAVLNADDPFYRRWSERAADKQQLSFGFSAAADVRAQNIQTDLQGSHFTLLFGAQQWPVNLPLLGEHNVRNALAVAAAGFALQLPAEKIIAGLQAAGAVSGRLQWVTGVQGQRILNDAYNANPASVKAAIHVLKHAPRSWLVLGDMAELGADAVQQHADIGVYARRQGIQHVLATGPLSKATTDAFGAGAHWFATQNDLVRFLQQQTRQQDVILVKGSRSAGMDQVVTALQKNSEEH